jgi:hypothetical protein
MPEIADWLEQLGMPEYVECFAEHKIDVTVLGYLTENLDGRERNPPCRCDAGCARSWRSARRCCSSARPGSANRRVLPRGEKTSSTSRTPACACIVLRREQTVHIARLSTIMECEG